MEKDFAGFDIETGGKIRQGLKEENEEYVKSKAPQRYWDALIPKHEIGCKRKVLDTDYLASLWRDNVELVHDDPVEEIVGDGARTKSGKLVKADAIVMATGFATYQMLFPMKIIGQNGISLNEHWDAHHKGAAQAYFGTCIPSFPNFFTLMGPNTVTGHLSVIYTVECQINFVLRLMGPVLKSFHPSSVLPSGLSSKLTAVAVKPQAASADSTWLQSKLSKLVWASGCTSWALDPKTGLNIAMYPEFQYLFWWRSIFIPGSDFDYVDSKTGKQRSLVLGGWKTLENITVSATVMTLLAGGFVGVQRLGGWTAAEGLTARALRGVMKQTKALVSAR